MIYMNTLDTANAAYYFSTTSDDKINDCGFKFSMVSEWHILFEEDKDTIHQSFPHQIFKIINSPKFYPATILRYMVLHF